MNAALLLALAAMLALCGALPEGGTYSSQYDQVDLEGLLGDPEKTQAFVQCFLQEGNGEPCTEMGRRVKAVLPEALPQDCSKCTEAQKRGLAKTVKFLAKNKPDTWKKLQDKFDPQGAYAKAHPELFE